MRFSKAQMDALIEKETRMANADRDAAEKSAKRNELESNIYANRDKIATELAPYCPHAEAGIFAKSLENDEDWLYSDDGFGAAKSVYAEKFAQITAIGRPIELRLTESASRAALVVSLKSAIETYKSFISDEERASCRQACNDAESWMYENQGKQADLAQFVAK